MSVIATFLAGVRILDLSHDLPGPLGEALEADRIKARGLVTKSGHGALQALFPALVDGVAPRPRPPLTVYKGDA